MGGGGENPEGSTSDSGEETSEGEWRRAMGGTERVYTRDRGRVGWGRRAPWRTVGKEIVTARGPEVVPRRPRGRNGEAGGGVGRWNPTWRGGGVGLQLINVDGLTRQKLRELEEKFFVGAGGGVGVYNILCIVETHHRWVRYDVLDGLESFYAMRGREDKKGGGLQIIIRKHEQVTLRRKETVSPDVLMVEGVCFGMTMRIILVYFDVNKGPAGRVRNEKIRVEVQRGIEGNKSDYLVVLGDFNGHMKVLEGERKEDENGKMVGAWLRDYDLVLMNADEKCEGVYTRTRGAERSAIDMVLVNKKMYEACRGMKIDEEKREIDFSDHNLISLSIRAREARKHRFGRRWVKGVYYKKDEETLGRFAERTEGRWVREDVRTVGRMTKVIKEVAESELKRRYRRRTSKEGGTVVIEKKWMTAHIRAEIDREGG